MGWLLVLAAGLVATVAACSQGRSSVPMPGSEGDFVRAREAYERGHLPEAIESLEAFERDHPGSQFIDDALYYLGKAHQANGEQILARQDFRRLLDGFPRSPFSEDALFETARSWFLSVRGPALDPEPAEEALRAFRTYLGRYPQGKSVEAARQGEQDALGQLAEKDYLNGETYRKLHRYAAARRYYEKSLERWPESPVSALALQGIARTCEREGDKAAAQEAYRRLAEHLSSAPERYRDGPDLAREARRKSNESGTSEK